MKVSDPPALDAASQPHVHECRHCGTLVPDGETVALIDCGNWTLLVCAFLAGVLTVPAVDLFRDWIVAIVLR